MANLITILRILASAALLFCPALSPAFFAVYIFAGVTDMLDGFVARRTGTASDFGAKLDTAADLIFV
ncbi:MAG: CDP-alcohol phosphatidyltransferase family protein, partial [Clostridia bacterium]|nr:CDP-alcohol phosphatidyltransferase family protein [Clostridia bacterium]